MELVSIIMPANKAEAFIHRSVQSVLKQSYKNWELIVISEDEIDYSSVFVKKGIMNNRIKFISTIKTGISSARNIGIQHAKGNIITVLDADDVFHPQKN
jgi:glycosyltransferase involved in cell wall biosynthesis